MREVPSLVRTLEDPVNREHGFYIDGVDEDTARLPPDWTKRAVTWKSKSMVGRLSLSHLVPRTSLSRNSPGCPRGTGSSLKRTTRPLDRDLIIERIKAIRLESAFQEQAIAFVGRLSKTPGDQYGHT